MTELALIIASFFIGSLPFSVWIGRYAIHKDIRAYGDGNPGATNVIHAGGLAWGGLALLLDLAKGAVPVGIANDILHIDGLPLVIIATLPPLGHAFSPFLGFRGGKAIATTIGTWIGLTFAAVPLVWAVMITYWYLALTVSGWAVILTTFSTLLYLILNAAHPALLGVWLTEFVLLVYKHRADLSKRPGLRLSPLFRPFFSYVEFDRDTDHERPHHHRAHHAAQRPHLPSSQK